jgi:hypothetical protein
MRRKMVAVIPSKIFQMCYKTTWLQDTLEYLCPVSHHLGTNKKERKKYQFIFTNSDFTENSSDYLCSLPGALWSAEILR